MRGRLVLGLYSNAIYGSAWLKLFQIRYAVVVESALTAALVNNQPDTPLLPIFLKIYFGQFPNREYAWFCQALKRTNPSVVSF